MRHRKSGRKLNRTSSHRRAMLRNLVTSLFRHEEIATTHAKAKTARPIAERMITLAKRGDLHARRQALSYIMDKSVAHSLFDEIKDRFRDRQGGYVRILRTGYRRGDNAPLALMQLVTAGQVKDKKGKPKTSKKAASKKAKASENAVDGKTAPSAPKEKEPEDTQQKG
ncbi:MAG: 50S ribosomal protein L17 [Thermodesulfobacteriota bacterium]